MPFFTSRAKDNISQPDGRSKSKVNVTRWVRDIFSHGIANFTSTGRTPSKPIPTAQDAPSEDEQSSSPLQSHSLREQSSSYLEEDLYMSGALPTGDICKHQLELPLCVTSCCAAKRK